MKKKKAVTLTEVLIALSIGVAILIPTTAMFSTSSRLLEKSSNLSLASGLARYILQGMMTMETSEIQSTDLSGISFCDESEDNVYFQRLFELQNDCGDLKAGKINMGRDSAPKLYARLAKYDYRYFISAVSCNTNGIKDDIMLSVSIIVTWKEFGVDKLYETHAFIVPR
jgi:hypothetical protein